MATATRAPQHKVQVKGSVTLETLCSGRYIPVATHTFGNAAQRAGVMGSAQAWGERTADSRVVEHFYEDGKGRHVVRFEHGRAEDSGPADGGWEFETAGLSVRGLRVVDLAETPAPVSGWQREYTRNGATYDAPDL